MKKFLILFLVVTSSISLAQESALLRLKYNKGDVYTVKMMQSMNSTAMMMGNEMVMEMNVVAKEGDISSVETRISKMVVDVLQGEMQMSFDSSMKDDELDEMGKMMKSQMSPFLKVVITTKINELGNTLETLIEPNIAGADQFKNQTVSYPEKAVEVGDVWTDENDVQGVKTITEYKVAKITESDVEVAVSGTISGLGSGSVEGTMTIDRATGVPSKSVMNSKIDAGGQVTNIKVNMTTTKN